MPVPNKRVETEQCLPDVAVEVIRHQTLNEVVAVAAGTGQGTDEGDAFETEVCRTENRSG